MFKNIFKKNREIQIDKILKEAKKSEKEFKNKENSNKIEENFFDNLEESVNLEDLECILEETVEEKIKNQNEINESIINEIKNEEEKEEIFEFQKKEKAYDYPNTQNSYLKNSGNDLFHDNVLIYGKENYFANQSIFRVIRENIRKGTGLIWFVNENEFLNVSEMIKSDSELFEYKDRVFTAFEIKEDFLENALLLSHIYIVLKENTFEDDLRRLELYKDNLEFLKIKERGSDFLPIVLSSNITVEDKIEEQIKELNKYNISFLIYAKSLYNDRTFKRYMNNIFNHFLILTKEIQRYKYIETSYIDDELDIHNEARITLVYDKKLNEKIEEETKKMKPAESFFINKENIKYIKF